MSRLAWIVVAVWAACPSLMFAAGNINPKGKELAAKLDSLHVKTLWLSQRYVDWETGKEITPKDSKKYTFATHCSAFVAAACMRMGVYILRPPDHSEVLLANAQFDWLHDQGKKHGWEPVTCPVEAQRLANQGKLVVVAFKSPDAKKSGHIAIVRPWVRSEAEIHKDGPEVIQAGRTNYEHITLRQGFGNHPGTWPNDVRFYVHRHPKLK